MATQACTIRHGVSFPLPSRLDGCAQHRRILPSEACKYPWTVPAKVTCQCTGWDSNHLPPPCSPLCASTTGMRLVFCCYGSIDITRLSPGMGGPKGLARRTGGTQIWQRKQAATLLHIGLSAYFPCILHLPCLCGFL